MMMIWPRKKVRSAAYIVVYSECSNCVSQTLTNQPTTPRKMKTRTMLKKLRGQIYPEGEILIHHARIKKRTIHSSKSLHSLPAPLDRLSSCLANSALLNTIGESDGNLYDRNALSSAQDASIVEDMAAIRDDLALAKGFTGRRRKRNRRQGSPSTGTRRKRERQRSKELQDLFEAGNLAYASADLPEAKRNYREIIRLDATESEAWMLLAQVHREEGDEKKEIGCRLVAAHLMHDVDTWRDLVERSK